MLLNDLMADWAGTDIKRSAQSGKAIAESDCDGLKPAMDFKPGHRFKFHKHMQPAFRKIRLFVTAH